MYVQIEQRGFAKLNTETRQSYNTHFQTHNSNEGKDTVHESGEEHSSISH